MPGTNGCTGECCKSFPINGLSFDALAAWAEEAIYHADLQKIVAMILPLEPTESDHKGWPRFTCKHFDAERKMCTNYANRPMMCSDYPYERGGVCVHCGLNFYQIMGVNPPFEFREGAD